MNQAPFIPSGPLKTVEQHFDYKGGWVRAPIREIVCNQSLTKQARLLWLWLASLKPGCNDYTWGDCEAELGCQTKARKSCLGQLVSQGFLEIRSDGVVVLKDPYLAYKQGLLLSDKLIVTSHDEIPNHQYSEITKAPAVTPKQTKPRQQSFDKQNISVIISAWNQYKPESFRSLRAVSDKQAEAFYKQMRNLNQGKENIEEFIKTICKGISKNNFWMYKVDSNGRTFSALFGYGNVGDTKLRNIQDLFDLGADQYVKPLNVRQDKPVTEDDETSSIRMYLDMAKKKGDPKEVAHWQEQLDYALNTEHGASNEF